MEQTSPPDLLSTLLRYRERINRDIEALSRPVLPDTDEAEAEVETTNEHQAFESDAHEDGLSNRFEDGGMTDYDGAIDTPDEDSTDEMAREVRELAIYGDDAMNTQPEHDEELDEAEVEEQGHWWTPLSGGTGHIFEDGLTDNELDAISDIRPQVYGEAMDTDDDSEVEECSYDESSGAETQDGHKSLQEEHEETREGLSSQNPNSQEDRNYSPSSPSQSAQSPTASSARFNELQEYEFRRLYFRYEGKVSIKSFKSRTEDHRWKVLEIEEAQKTLEEERIYWADKLRRSYRDLDLAEADVHDNYKDAGITDALRVAYEQFCESLQPEFGQRGGFSITCSSDHQGSYVEYDPDFILFKQAVEVPFDECIWRCEASVKNEEYVVEFWPIKFPEHVSEDSGSTTWEDRYPELYKIIDDDLLSTDAIYNLKLNLPGRFASVTRGWMFEYRFQESLRDHAVIGKRWRFRSAHRIPILPRI